MTCPDPGATFSSRKRTSLPAGFFAPAFCSSARCFYFLNASTLRLHTSLQPCGLRALNSHRSTESDLSRAKMPGYVFEMTLKTRQSAGMPAYSWRHTGSVFK